MRFDGLIYPVKLTTGELTLACWIHASLLAADGSISLVISIRHHSCPAVRPFMQMINTHQLSISIKYLISSHRVQLHLYHAMPNRKHKQFCKSLEYIIKNCTANT